VRTASGPADPSRRVTTVELVRHAQALGRTNWWGHPDRERPLNEEGRAQALALTDALARGPAIVAVYSSPSTRCVDTVAPLAERLGVDVRPAEALAEVDTPPVLDNGDTWVASAWLGGRGLAFLDEIVTAHEGARLVAVSHGDVIPAVLAALVGRDGLALSDVRCRKGDRYTLTFSGRRCVDAVAVPGRDP
jgi:8-oxo-(d)GTP phosphatase